MKECLIEVSEDKYESENYVMQREFEGESPNGDSFRRFWVLRKKNGEYVGYDQYRYDLATRYGLKIK
jgi:hypothetical protein